MEMNRLKVTEKYQQIAHDMENLRCKMFYEIKDELRYNLHFDGSIDFMDYEDNETAYSPIIELNGDYFVERWHIEQVMINDNDEIWLTLENDTTMLINELQFHEVFELYNAIANISEKLGDW
jgi:hypothetical protein